MVLVDVSEGEEIHGSIFDDDRVELIPINGDSDGSSYDIVVCGTYEESSNIQPFLGFSWTVKIDEGFEAITKGLQKILVPNMQGNAKGFQPNKPSKLTMEGLHGEILSNHLDSHIVGLKRKFFIALVLTKVSNAMLLPMGAIFMS